MSRIADLDRQYVWHPYTQHQLVPQATGIVRGEGALLYDEQGEAIIDAISSWWVTLHGHGEPAIAEAIAQQARTLEHVIFAGFSHAPAAELSRELMEVAPSSLARVFFTDDGSTAVEAALKMALQYFQHKGQKRSVIAALDGAYHGDTFGAMSVSGRGVFTEPFGELLFEVERLPNPAKGDVLGAFESLLQRRGSEVAAVIVEPLLLAAGGMQVWGEAVLQALRAESKKAGILLIADEVATGFGRTGPLFACQRADVFPDLMCLSKGITGGFLPLGATLATEEIFSAFLSEDRRKTFFHGHSYTGNPLACAAALASLNMLKSPECSRRRAAIESGNAKAMKRLSAYSSVLNGRALGTVAAFDLYGEGNYLDNVGLQLSAFARERGVLLRPLGNVVYVMPPYGITEKQLEQVWSVIEAFVSSI